MDQLSDNWTVIPTWNGTDMGEWPLVVVATCDDSEADVYGYARYVEGDVTLGAYDSHREHDIALDNYHVWLTNWKKVKRIQAMFTVDAPSDHWPVEKLKTIIAAAITGADLRAWTEEPTLAGATDGSVTLRMAAETAHHVLAAAATLPEGTRGNINTLVLAGIEVWEQPQTTVALSM